MNIDVNQKDEIIMRLVHYFVTEEDYQPIIVNGVKNEIWLENLDAPYKVIRINSNYIHNIDQLKFDNFKIKNVTRQIKRKTFSLNLKTLNILLDLNDDVELSKGKNIDNYRITTLKDVRKDDGLGGLFPKLKTMTLDKGDGFEAILNLTAGIAKKNEEDTVEYEKVFAPKKIVITYALIAINVVMFILEYIKPGLFFSGLLLDPVAVRDGEYYRLFTSMFLHADIIHLVVNMYALYVVGKEVETYLGKEKMLFIYLLSGVSGSLLSCMGMHYSVGASGAIFGLFGALLYFGYYYRLYFGSVLIKQILPVILINLLIGFTIQGIDNAAHIGGLIGGIFSTMLVGVNGKKNNNMISGLIITLVYIGVLIYLVFFGR